MCRAGFTVAIFLTLAAWAGAQGPAPTAADQIRLLRANRVLITDLVDGGVELGGTDDPLDRAVACQRTARAIGVALERAAEGQDADRVTELGEHLELVVRDALVPTIDEAMRIVPENSPRAVELKQLRARAAGDLDAARGAIPTVGPAWEAAKLKEVRGKLDGLREKLK